MIINTNTASLFSQRQLSQSRSALATSIERLSSGLRINSAADDAAGLAISNRLGAQIRGLNQAARNANDAISMLQVADGAVANVTDNLQRIRELAVQGANTAALSEGDRENIQAEVSQLLAEVQRITDTTAFGGKKLFSGINGSLADPNQQPIIDGLKSYWLREAEERITQFYGITASGGPVLDIEITDIAQAGVLAQVVSGFSGSTLVSQTLQIDEPSFTPPNLPNGGTAPFYNDRIIAHEMVHAVMARTMNLNDLRSDTNGWFTEGIAEFIHGADERVINDVALVDSDGGDLIDVDTDYQALINKLGDGSTEGTYSSGYIAVAYMHDELKNAGVTDGVKALMQHLSANPTDSLGDALNSLGPWAGLGAGAALTAFENDFTAGSGGAASRSGLDFMKDKMSLTNLTNNDTGAIGGLDADGGSELTAESVMPNVSQYNDSPLSGIATNFPDATSTIGSQRIAFQVGANANEEISVSLSGTSTSNLSIASIDVVNDAGLAIVAVDRAIEHISGLRADLGASMNRLQSTIANLQNISENVSASRSRILDTDYAAETAELTKNQIIQQAGNAMLVQANATPELVLQLLR